MSIKPESLSTKSDRRRGGRVGVVGRPRCGKTVLAPKAQKNYSVQSRTRSNQHRLLSILIATCAKPMRGSQIVVLWLLRIDEKASSKIGKRILRGFSLPVLYLSQLLFECVFLLQQTLILRLHVKQCGLEFNDRRLGLNSLLSQR